MTTESVECAVCGRDGDALYRFAAAGGSTVRCRRHALGYGPVRRRALQVAAIVGTVLVFINQGDVIASGQLTAEVGAKIALTYLVPFSVSTYSALAANRLSGSL